MIFSLYLITSLLLILTISLYLASAYLIYDRNSGHQQLAFNHQRWVSLTPFLIAVALHSIILKHQIYLPQGMNLGFFTSASLISWFVCIQLLIASITKKVETLGIVMLPFCALIIFLDLLIGSPQIIANIHLGIQTHIMISVLAYSLLTLGALQALALAHQDNAIKNHHPGGLVKHLPPIHDMEGLLFQILGFALLFLSAALISGFFFLDDLFAQHLAHKTVLSIVSWLLLLILLFGRYLFGWRGKTAIRWTLSSFTFILLAYFGSKFVLEFLVS